MKLTSATLHALRGLIHLARHGGKAAVPSNAMPGNAQRRYLLRALKALERAGVLHSTRGPHGGYRLARPAGRITLLDVIEAVEGPIRGKLLPTAATAEGKQFDARLQVACDRVAEATRRRLRRVTLADLAGE
jgi:Rrf2 family protein